MDKVYCLLQDIRKCPEIYIGKPSLERLYAYINGYLHYSNDESDNCLVGFTEYITKIYNINSDHNWSSVIQFFCITEEEAFNKFYEHFEDFLKYNNK